MKKILIAVGLLATLSLQSCVVRVGGGGYRDGYYGHHHHGHHRGYYR